MSKLVLDIETIGADYDSLDEITKESLTRWAEREARDEKDPQKILESAKQGLGLSPLTGEVVAIGVLDPDTEKGAVYFQSPGQKIETSEKNGIKYEVGTEKEILEKFWKVSEYVDEFISFNGRGFDAPFLMVRSAVHKIKSSKDLMSNRYLGSQRYGALHVDLFDQLTFYGAVQRKGSLHLWCNAFGIKSPKSEGVSGDQVSELFKNKEYLKIAQYNARDVKATRELYGYWDKYMRF